jgi:hypothetical protein
VFLLLISLDVSSWQLGFMLAPSKKKKNYEIGKRGQW